MVANVGIIFYKILFFLLIIAKQKESAFPVDGEGGFGEYMWQGKITRY
jgi:hypothetical protein